MSVGLWATDTQDDNRTTTGQSRAAPRSFSSSRSLIINIIHTDFNDAPNSSEVKQCALSVPGYEHSAPHKNNLTTLENNPIFRDWQRIPVAQITSREYSSTYITKSFTAYYLVRVESDSRFNQLQTTLQRAKLDSILRSKRLLRKNKNSRVHRAQCSNSELPCTTTSAAAGLSHLYRDSSLMCVCGGCSIHHHLVTRKQSWWEISTWLHLPAGRWCASPPWLHRGFALGLLW